MRIQDLRPELNSVLLAFLLVCLITILAPFLATRPSILLVSVCWAIFTLFLVSHLTRFPMIGALFLIGCGLVGMGFVLPKPVAIWMLDYPNAFLDYFGFSISAGKVFHVIVYAVAGAGYVVMMSSIKVLYSCLTLTIVLFVAMFMSEVFQLYVPNRSSSMKDIAYNAIGVVSGVGIALAACLISKFRTCIRQTRCH